MAALERLASLHKRFGAVEVLKGIDLDVEQRRVRRAASARRAAASRRC